MRLFLDVEWENETTREVVSLALVSQDRGHSFYAERDPLPNAPSTFVREVVYPLLDRGATALSDAIFTKELHAFLVALPDPLILADSGLDLALLASVLGGFGQPGLPPAPPYRSMLITFGDVQMRVEDYFEDHPEARVRRHHAMVDAEALRWAFETAIARGRGPLED